MSRLVVGPFNRVEGDLEVRLEIDGGQVKEAWVISPLYRGFEQIMLGRDPLDSLVIVPRICGICSVSQSMAAVHALREAQGIQMPPNGELATNLMLACENLADHLTHFYLFFMPDFARPIYAQEPWYLSVAERFRAGSGSAAKEFLQARAQLLHLMGLLAGKWPHSLSLQPGGSTRAVQAQERIRLAMILAGFRRFLEARLFGDALEAMLALDGIAALEAWSDRTSQAGGDFGVFLQLVRHLRLDRLGCAVDRFMSYGNYQGEGRCRFAPGLWCDGELFPLDASAIAEDLSHAFLLGGSKPQHPTAGNTLPVAEKPGAYTWCKAPRLDGRVVEVGALARQVVDGQPLIRELVDRSGGNVANRVIARLIESVRLLVAMEAWVRALEPGEPFCVSGPMPQECEGVGLVEAARGSLGHWLRVRNGRILNYQIVAPTTWNFSPRDHQGVPGVLEQALVGTEVREGERTPVAVQHIVRSFDPCMVCTVH
ncbi:nickel-dependent hydrogenase large subunit [Thiorhodococcus mannitoliphagus]|uniref:Nickel-dependent hydrogenase large subunit n=1 Tax=Thiorhodococcus mannitoliphagus TaxID=329406 RepID=A0A6P1DQ49_9GAMM|nr:nickel-dependent hydrogenase large subunit [Thiorhodococcus mannitoliphagus]NEX19051.1 nickel-dependent hydrogenase large subunit [Thiorhodococcus mannitoliphagus]